MSRRSTETASSPPTHAQARIGLTRAGASGTGTGGSSGARAESKLSSAGTSILIYGDARGLRLRRTDGAPGDPIAEPYLLLADEAIVA